MEQELDINEVIAELTGRFAMKVAELEKEISILKVAKRQLEKKVVELNPTK